MTRRTFFSFNYNKDIWRVNQIRNIPNVIGTSAAGFEGPAGPSGLDGG